MCKDLESVSGAGVAEMKWQPIEKAPKDGTRIILYVPPGDYEVNRNTKERATYDARVGEGLWTGDGMEYEGWYWANDSCNCCWGNIYPGEPTLWQPLPTPP